MSNRVSLLALTSMLILCLAGCGGQEPQQTAQTAPTPPPKAAEPPPVIYELTKEDILTSHPDWTSRNISILGVKLGDITRNVEKNLGALDNTRSLPNEYLTVYQGNGLFVYTTKLTGKIRKFEVNEVFAKKLTDEKLKKLLSSGDLKYMREILGPEEGAPIENAEDNSTEYPYDSKGFRFVKYKVDGGKFVNTLAFIELKKTGTT
jgi:hypothetical protein